MNPAISLFLGIICGIAINNKIPSEKFKKISQQLLMISIIGLGAGMNLRVIGRVGGESFFYTIITISLTIILAFAIGKYLKLSKDMILLMGTGTAICGGSAIAAVAAAIRAKHEDVTVALATVFSLNALALFIFPAMGHMFGFSETQFGLWSALAVHDTSSVVGTTLQYGPQALQVGTTVKLVRALWIMPVAIIAGMISRDGKVDSKKFKVPWFILGFILMSAIVTWLPGLIEIGQSISNAAKYTLIAALFFIGTSINLKSIKSIGIKPFILGIALWFIVASLTATYILVTNVSVTV